MSRVARRAAVLAAALAAACTRSAGPLPDGAALGAYSDVGQPESYNALSLYAYMDGGADLYREYGFVRAGVRRYGGDNRNYTVELFEMKDGPSARAVYSHTRRAGSETDLAAGCRASVSDSETKLAKGRHYLVCRDDGPTSPSAVGASELCRRVAQRLTGECGTGDLFALLPAEGRAPGSEIAIVGPLGLNVRPWLAAVTRAGFERGWLAAYEVSGRKVEVFVGVYRDAEGARRAATDIDTAHRPGLESRVRERRVVLAEGSVTPDPAIEALVTRCLSGD